MMALNPPLARSNPSSSLLNPAVVGGKGKQANIDVYDNNASVSAPPATPASGDDDGRPSPQPPSSWPKLFLDSGACFHMVGDPRLLSVLSDAPAGMAVTVANGNTLPVTKIGDIQMTKGGFRIFGVFLVPGLKVDLISVRQLSRIRICTWFDGDRAMLYRGSELVGVAVGQENLYGLYVLQFLKIPVCCGSSAYSPWLKPELPPFSQLPMHGDDGTSSPLAGPKLLLDSGAGSHMVSDPRLLSNLRDAPAVQTVVAADGNTMPSTKIGDIHIQGLSIPDILLVPGLKFDGLISVRQLARESGICTWFVGDRAKLYAGLKLVGVAVAAQKLADLYVLQFLRTPKIAAAKPVTGEMPPEKLVVQEKTKKNNRKKLVVVAGSDSLESRQDLDNVIMTQSEEIMGEDPMSHVDLCRVPEDLEIELEEKAWTKVVNRKKKQKK